MLICLYYIAGMVANSVNPDKTPHQDIIVVRKRTKLSEYLWQVQGTEMPMCLTPVYELLTVVSLHYCLPK